MYRLETNEAGRSKGWTRWFIRITLAWARLKVGWNRFRMSRMGMLGLGLVACFGVLAFLQPILISSNIWPAGIYDPVTGHDLAVDHPAPPSLRHPLGTDGVGRDVLSMLMAATRPVFILGVVSALTTGIVGTLVGAFSAYYKGAVDQIFSRIVDIFLLLPAPIVLIVFGARRAETTPETLGLIFGLLTGLSSATVVLRTLALTIIARPHVEAARVAGGGALHILGRHVIPEMLPMAALQMMIAVTGAVVADGFLGYTGLTRSYLNWGTMLFQARDYSLTLLGFEQWHVLAPPAMALSLFSLGFYLISRGFREVADPRAAARHRSSA